MISQCIVTFAILFIRSTLATEFYKEPCEDFSTGPTSIECQIYNSSDACKSIPSLTNNNYRSDNPTEPDVKEFTVNITEFRDSPGYHRAVITWKSHGYGALNRTIGFLLTMEEQGSTPNDLISKWCRYFEVSSSSNAVTLDDANNQVFGFTTGWVEEGKTYLLSLTPYPYSTTVITTANLISFIQNGVEKIVTEAPPPTSAPPSTTTAQPELNKTVSVEFSTPFTVLASFSRALYQDIRYNHTKYRLGLYKIEANNWNPANDVHGNQIQIIEFNSTKNGESITVSHTFTNVMPGQYMVRVRPDRTFPQGSTECNAGCELADTQNRYSSQHLTVTGEAYRPISSPVLVVDSERNFLNVTFEVAPPRLHIASYALVFSNQDGVQITRNFNPETWQVVDDYNRIAQVEYLQLPGNKFNYGDQLTVQIKTNVISTLCSDVTLYNFDGTCVSQPVVSKSAEVSLLRETIVTKPPGSSISGQELTLAELIPAIVFPCAAGLVAIALVVYCCRKSIIVCIKKGTRNHQGDLTVTPLDTVSVSPTNEVDSIGDGMSLLIANGPRVPIRIAYVPTEAYTKVAKLMEHVLTKYFHCHVMFYTGEHDRSSPTQPEVVIVLHSDSLFKFHQTHMRNDSVSMYNKDTPHANTSLEQQYMRTKRVLDLLQTVRQIDNQTVMLVTFDHLSAHQCDKLTVCSGNRVADIFKFPKEFQKMTQKIHSPRTSIENVECPSWRYYEPSVERISLEAAIKEMPAEPSDHLDSGLDSMSQCTYQTVGTTTPEQYADTRMITITPNAPEMALLRQHSVDNPISPASDPQRPLLHAHQHHVLQHHGNQDMEPVLREDGGRINHPDNMTYLSVAQSIDSYACSTIYNDEPTHQPPPDHSPEPPQPPTHYPPNNTQYLPHEQYPVYTEVSPAAHTLQHDVRPAESSQQELVVDLSSKAESGTSRQNSEDSAYDSAERKVTGTFSC